MSALRSMKAALFGLTALAFVPATAQGQSYDYCVACTAPKAVYLCTVGPREHDPGARAWANYCAERVRNDVGHAQCSALPLTGQCQATRAFVFKGTRATPQQAEALVSPVPEERRSAAAEIWDRTLARMEAAGESMQEGVDAMGRSVEESAEAMERGAENVGDSIMDGLRDMGEGISRGTDCVISLGDRC